MGAANDGRATPDEFALVADSAPVPMWLTGPDRRRTFVNRAYAEFMGVDRERALTFDWLEVVHPDDRERIAREADDGASSSAPVTLEARFRRSDGNWRWLKAVSQPRLDERGEPVGFIGVAHDVTEAREADARLRARERQLSALVEQTTAGLSQVDAEGRFTFVNDRFCAIVGRTREDLLSLTMQDITHPDDLARNLSLFEGAVGQGAPYSHEKRYVRPDGSIVWVNNAVASVRDRQGELTGVMAVTIDTTARRAAEASFRRGEESMRLAIEGAGMATFELNLTTMEGSGSATWFELLGHPAAGNVPDGFAHWLAHIHPDDRARARAAAERCFAEGAPFSIEYRILRADTGERRWLQSHGSRIAASGDWPARFVGVSFDITDSHHAADALADSERRLRFLGELTEAIAVETDPGEILRVTIAMLGAHLDVEHCAYLDIDHDQNVSVARAARYRSGAAPVGGVYELDGFGPRVASMLRAGESLIVEDHEAEPGSEAERDVYRALGVRATICIPLVKDGQLTALMTVHDTVPRHWTEAELRLVREVIERSWAHIERARAQAELDESTARLRLAIDSARIGTWEWDLTIGQAKWSDRVADILGRPTETLVTQDLRLSIMHPDDRDWVSAVTERSFETGEVYAAEYRILRPDGEVRWVASRGIVSFSEGRAVRFTGTLRDVTDRRRAQEDLEALAHTLEQRVADRTAERDRMWRLTGDLMLVVDARWRVRAANPATRPLLGVDPEDLTGQRIKPYFHPDDWPAVRAVLRIGGHSVVGDFTARVKDGAAGWRHFSWTAAPGEGEAYVIGRDTTAEVARRAELEQAQDALRQAQKVESLGQLTGGVAHDFNNLLTPIIGNLDLLRRRITGEREVRLLGSALEAAERARTLIQRLLAFARRQPLRPGPVDVAQLVDGMADLIASTSGPQIKLVLDIAPDLPAATADLNQLEMAVLNLSVNARDAMPDGGLLTIAARLVGLPEGNAAKVASGRYVRLSVADTGIGMDADTLARAVEPFFSTKGIGKGTGLGLSMVHGLAMQLGGGMHVASKPGLGTVVELFLPLSSVSEQAAAVVPDGLRAHTPSGRLLLVDDDAAVRVTTRAMLEELGYRVTEASNAADALKMIVQAEPDYVVTDHLMPGLPGAELVRVLHRRHPRIKVLLVSGYAELDSLTPDIPRLAKPFRQHELASSLAAL
jgi:PAS domain S-box-containing protein